MELKAHTSSNLLRICFLSVSMLLSSIDVFAQQNTAYLDYIRKYRDIAVEQMHEYGIPASITLAQGLLESAAGRSDLATKGNNHFGIKCGGSWVGESMTHDDDRNGECFRVYKNAEESFKDHSVFLQKQRYRRLFSLDRKDYKGWARGLKECGYATSPTYAAKLINIIELYELHLYDDGKKKASSAPAVVQQPVVANPRITVYPNGIPYVVVGNGESLQSISTKYGISERKIRKYNELPKNAVLQSGDVIYLAKKKTKASKAFKTQCWHKVQRGQSMYDIAQTYGIRLRNLYKRNYKSPDYVPREGDLLKIR